MRRSMLIAAVALALGACASGGNNGAPDKPRPNPDVITAEEIAAVPVQNAYDAVSRLRPSFFTTQGGTTRTHAVQVVVDGIPQGGVNALRNIIASEVVEIRRMSAADATMRWGTGYSGGAILVRTVRGGRS